MSKKIIPEQTITLCDRCSEPLDKHQRGAHMDILSTDFAGATQDLGGHRYNIDLCPHCYNDFQLFLKDKPKKKIFRFDGLG